jgi:hypothetical protein
MKVAAKLSHYAFYVLVIGMPLIGWGMLSAADYPVVLFGAAPVCSTPKRKLKNSDQRPAPETHPPRTEIPDIADQRLGHPGLTRGNVGDSPPQGNNSPETELRG